MLRLTSGVASRAGVVLRMTDAAGSRAHERTRRDHSTETAEDYVEAIAALADANGQCRVTDLAERFGVTHVTVIRIVQRLERDGLVVTAPYRPIELTPKGRRLAKKCKERHELVYRFLLASVLIRKLRLWTPRVEHHVSPATLDCFRRFADGDSGVRMRTDEDDEALVRD